MISSPKELIGFIYYRREIFRKIRNFEKFPGKLKKFPGSLGYPDYPLLKGKTIETSKLLNKLNEHNQVSLYKVAAHTGVSGNKRADSLAKEGAKANPTGPEPFLCLSWNNVISELLNKAKKKP